MTKNLFIHNYLPRRLNFVIKNIGLIKILYGIDGQNRKLPFMHIIIMKFNTVQWFISQIIIEIIWSTTSNIFLVEPLTKCRSDTAINCRTLTFVK